MSTRVVKKKRLNNLSTLPTIELSEEMSGPKNVRFCKELQFERKHKMFNNSQIVTPQTFNFKTAYGNLQLSWQILYTLNVDQSCGYNSSLGRYEYYRMDNIEVKLLDKMYTDYVAYVNIEINCYPLYFKFDSKSAESLKRSMSDLRVKDSASLMQVSIRLLTEDKGAARKIENYNSYVESEKSCNVKLCVGEENFSAHREILAFHSSIFASKFEHDSKVLQIKDVEPKILKYLIDYIYFAEVDCDDIADWLKLIVAAEKYSVMTLLTLCENHITEKLNAENVAEVFTIADLVKSEELKKECVKFIVKNKAIVLKTPGYKNLVKTRSDLVSELFSYIMLCCSLKLESDDE